METAFFSTIRHGHVGPGSTAKALLDLAPRTSTVAARNRHSMTPLHVAAKKGHLQSIEWLIQNGASVLDEDANGRVPKQVAQRHGMYRASQKLAQLAQKQFIDPSVLL